MVPNNPNHKSTSGRTPVALATVAPRINILAVHFTYQDKSPFGVTFFKNSCRVKFFYLII
jgi:hypothetical protein